MGNLVSQTQLFGEAAPASQWDRDLAKRSLDELFAFTQQYRHSDDFKKLLDFIAKFRFYAPYNAMLIHMQLPGATYVATPSRWFGDYGRRIKQGARPLVILRPMGPVMFVYDVKDTDPIQGAPPLPKEVTAPFEVRSGRIGSELDRTLDNASRDGIQVVPREAGTQSAGQIGPASGGRFLYRTIKSGKKKDTRRIPVRYEILLNLEHSNEAKYVSLVHELGHLYCGHLGTPNPRWWPDRRNLGATVNEFEAESVCYLVCARLGLDNPSEQYLAAYIDRSAETPAISLDCVMKAAGLIEEMGRIRLGFRKTHNEKPEGSRSGRG